MTLLAPHTTMLRDQILSALQEAYPAALSTNQIAERMPPIVCRRYCESCEWWCGPNVRLGEGVEILECHGDWHLIRRPRTGEDIHKHLCAMARQGLITRLAYNRSAHPCVFWIVEPDPAAAGVIDDLEVIWAAT
jgi:hypothetical protein